MEPTHTLVIACGNPLRGDDALGPAAGDSVRAWRLPGVRVLVVHQLTPELIEEMKQADRLLFIDAAIDLGDRDFEIQRIAPLASRVFLGHHQTPADLLELLRRLEGREPEAWLMSIAAHSFDHGAALSACAQARLRAALAWVRRFLAEQTCTKSA